jgi:hypothetical protein
MIKRLILSLVLAFGLSAPSHAAGTVPGISMTQQLDALAKPLSGGKLYLIQAGTTSTPQNCYQDTALTLAWPNPITLDASGRVPQLFCADGNIKIRLTDRNGVQQIVQDNLLVVGPSGGGGGGGTVDPTTILSTGDIKVAYGTGILSGFVRANGRTIGSATSGATERANSDVQALFLYLWGADANLAVSGGRGASGAADWAANKTIALPDLRGRVLAGLDDMGNSPAGRLSVTYFGASGPCSTQVATALGAACGGESQTLTLPQLPTGITVSGSNTIVVSGPAIGNIVGVGIGGTGNVLGTGGTPVNFSGAWIFNGVNTITGTSTNTSGAAHPNVQPTMLATYYLKL